MKTTNFVKDFFEAVDEAREEGKKTYLTIDTVNEAGEYITVVVGIAKVERVTTS